MGTKQVFNPLSGNFDVTYKPDGGEIFSGAGTPSESLAPAGSYYFDTSRLRMYGPKLAAPAVPVLLFTRDFSTPSIYDQFDDTAIDGGNLKWDNVTYGGYDFSTKQMTGVDTYSQYILRLHIVSYSGDGSLDTYGPEAPYLSFTSAELAAAVGGFVECTFNTNQYPSNTFGMYLEDGTGTTIEISHFEVFSTDLKWGNGYSLEKPQVVDFMAAVGTTDPHDLAPSVNVVRSKFNQAISTAQNYTDNAIAVSAIETSINYTCSNNDDVVVCTNTITIDLPIIGFVSKQFTIKNAGSGVITVLPAGGSGDTIEGGASYIIPEQFQSITIVSVPGSYNWTVASTTNSFSNKPSVTIPALDIDWASGNVFNKSVAANSTLTFSNKADGRTISVIVINTSGGAITLTLPAGIKVATGFSLSVPASKANIYTFMQANSIVYASHIEGLA